MQKAQKVAFLCFLLFIVSLLFVSEANSLPPRHPVRRGTVPAPAARARAQVRHHQYVRTHDYNHDGKVDVKDRLRWIQNHAEGYSTVYITDDDADLIEIMDINGDGSVDITEIRLFYNAYDSNNNGVLEDIEIEAAVE